MKPTRVNTKHAECSSTVKLVTAYPSLDTLRLNPPAPEQDEGQGLQGARNPIFFVICVTGEVTGSKNWMHKIILCGESYLT